jgi:hypothetical protein
MAQELRELHALRKSAAVAEDELPPPIGTAFGAGTSKDLAKTSKEPVAPPPRDFARDLASAYL